MGAIQSFVAPIELGEASIALSVIVPYFDEHAVLPICHRRVAATLATLAMRTEVVYVDDGSVDGSTELLAGLVGARKEDTVDIRIVRLSRNFGKEAAIMAGIEHASGDAVVILDADLQDPPELIPQMVAAWKAGVDVVCMQRRSRAGETYFKRASAHLYYRLLQRLSGSPMPVDTGDFRLMSRAAVRALCQLRERCRYTKGLYAWIGLPTTVLTYDREPRAAGRSRWGIAGLMGLAVEGLTSFSIAPLRWVTTLGVIAAMVGGVVGLRIIIETALYGSEVPGYPSLVALLTFFSGVQLITTGLLGEYVGKTYLEAKQRPLYLVRDVTRIPPAALDGAQ